MIRSIIKYIVIDKDPPDSNEGELEEKIKRSKEKPKAKGCLDEVLVELDKNKDKKKFSIDVKKERKEIDEALSFVVKYSENEREQRLTVEKEGYSFDIVKEKEVIDDKPYEFTIVYENNPGGESLKVSYKLRDYPSEREDALQDFSGILDKTLHIMPKSIMGGVLGYTYLGENFMARRDDLVGDMAKMVDVHEAIHTNNEYETRILTSWILSRERVRYKR